MNNIVGKVFEAETKAEEIIQKAKNRSSDILKEAETLADEKIQNTRQEANTRLRETVEQSRIATENALQKELKDTQTESDEFFLAKKDEIIILAEAILHHILLPEYEQEGI